jgi:hypothetical protein
MTAGLYGDSQPILEETFVPTAATAAYRFVDGLGNQITVAGQAAAGISAPMDSISAADVTNKRAIRIVTLGSGAIELGGTVALGDALMSTSGGIAVKWVPGAGNFKSAVAREAGVSGDRIRAFVLPQSSATSGLAPGSGAVLTVGTNTIAPTNVQHHVGAGLIKTITVPAGGLADGTILQLIPDAAFTYDATGNIVVPAGGGTAVINKVMLLAWDAVATKWTPSY